MLLPVHYQSLFFPPEFKLYQFQPVQMADSKTFLPVSNGANCNLTCTNAHRLVRVISINREYAHREKPIMFPRPPSISRFELVLSTRPSESFLLRHSTLKHLKNIFTHTFFFLAFIDLPDMLIERMKSKPIVEQSASKRFTSGHNSGSLAFRDLKLDPFAC